MLRETVKSLALQTEYIVILGGRRYNSGPSCVSWFADLDEWPQILGTRE